jgi:hypothetical protein
MFNHFLVNSNQVVIAVVCGLIMDYDTNNMANHEFILADTSFKCTLNYIDQMGDYICRMLHMYLYIRIYDGTNTHTHGQIVHTML